MKSRLRIITILCFLGLLCAVPAFAFAQIPVSLDLINIKTSPPLPKPGEMVTISVESFSTDLNGASIIWLVDGKNFAQGIGKKSIELKAPLIGKTMSVMAVIMSIEKVEIKKALILKTGDVDIIWESEGFIPPLYQGRAEYGYQNQIRIYAIPHLSDGKGGETDPQTLLYKWKVNDKVQLAQSGYGKQSLVLREELPKDLDVVVEVTTKEGIEKATADITLSPGKPSISFYEDNPLYGVFYNRSLKQNVQLTNQEINVRAVPYSFSITPQSPLSYLWSINNEERRDLESKESIILRTRGDVEGTSNISLDVRSEENILQGARANLSLMFTTRKSSNNFSF